MSSVSIIIPAWNGRDYLHGCLAALLAHAETGTEVLVVDNASTDGSAEMVEAEFPTVRLIRNAHNLGFAGGCNVGLRQARGEVMILLNQDTEVQVGWLPPLLDALSDHAVGVAGCKLLYPDGTIQHAGMWLEWPQGLAHHYGHGEPDSGKWNEARDVEAVTGAALAFRRDVMERVGLLDEGFWPGYFEDTDFCLRVRAAGLRIRYVPQATVVHQESTSTRDAETRSTYYQRGRLRFLLKHLSPDRFLTEFVPAEEDLQRPAIFGNESQALRLAYLGAIVQVAPLLREQWHADGPTIAAVVRALQWLYHGAWLTDWERGLAVTTEQLAPAQQPILLAEGSTPPPLHPFEFSSEAPVVGPLLARFRRTWYNVASRWAVQFLQEQQERINQQQASLQARYVRTLEQRIRTLSDENALLAQEIAHLRLELTHHNEELKVKG